MSGKPSRGIDALPDRRMLWRWVQDAPVILGGIFLVLVSLCALGAPIVAPYDAVAQEADARLQGPSRQHWLGTDEFGRDIFSRIIFGSRTAILVGVISTAIGLLGGATLGVIGGFYGGGVDHLIMRTMDVMLSFPTILLAIMIVAVLGPSVLNLMTAVGVSRVPIFARLSRGVVLTVKQEQYVEAAVSVGGSPSRIVARHLVPNIGSSLIVQATAALAEAIVIASSLNFLGLGVQPPTPDWGAMVSSGRRFIFDHPYIPLFPGLAITAVVLSLNVVGDWLRDVLDPRLRSA